MAPELIQEKENEIIKNPGRKEEKKWNINGWDKQAIADKIDVKARHIPGNEGNFLMKMSQSTRKFVYT